MYNLRMRNSFWSGLNVPTEVKTIEQDTLEKAVNFAYQDIKYGFFNNPWFIDVKNRFRIFRFEGKIYIAKETNIDKADIEVVNSKNAYERLDGKIIRKKELKIIVPQRIASSSGENRCFLVSEYVGLDLNGIVYSKRNLSLSITDCLAILKLLLENGVVYRGYIPRNITVKEHFIYLFDWEETYFVSSTSTSLFDHLWRTNLLLNWSYLFDYATLVYELDKQIDAQDLLSESVLVKYETTFRRITSDNTSDYLLRNDIDRIVFGSELPLMEEVDQFYLRPNDIGHLISDIFPSEIDVLHDMVSHVTRKRSEHDFSYNTQVTTHLLSLFYMSASLRSYDPKSSLRYYALVPILLMIDGQTTAIDYKKFLSKKTLQGLVVNIYNASEAMSVVRSYLSGEKDKLCQLLSIKIPDKIMEACPGARIQKSELDNLVSFIMNESVFMHKLFKHRKI